MQEKKSGSAIRSAGLDLIPCCGPGPLYVQYYCPQCLARTLCARYPSESMKEKKSKGIEIIPAFDIVDHDREAWVSPEERAIVVDMTHPFYEKCSLAPSIAEFNFTRIIIEACILHKQKEHTWGPEETFGEFRKLFHQSWG